MTNLITHVRPVAMIPFFGTTYTPNFVLGEAGPVISAKVRKTIVLPGEAPVKAKRAKKAFKVEKLSDTPIEAGANYQPGTVEFSSMYVERKRDGEKTVKAPVKAAPKAAKPKAEKAQSPKTATEGVYQDADLINGEKYVISHGRHKGEQEIIITRIGAKGAVYGIGMMANGQWTQEKRIDAAKVLRHVA